MPTQIVSPLGSNKVIPEERAEPAELPGGVRGQWLDDLPRPLLRLVRVVPSEVAAERIGSGLGEKVRAAGERLRSQNSSSIRRCTVSTTLWSVGAAGGMRRCWRRRL
ncbi:MAG: hypothetical protein HYS38_06130 [Acidobacteria bacterium]|nr:hypothetical protein [Acidobacteriota bacterium]